ncbi:MAG: carbohydrate binding family 9 domain-containing protein [candidate division WOR-3 bacterium]|nr:MAG: carbohydrate binding family 9 domain-containing protein [candidate division WOR-3 bacterium]
MTALLLLFALNVDGKSVEVRYTEIAPDIDGFIEETWLQADSAYDFVQFMPYEKSAPSERTTVYVLQDKDNLYVAFRCYADSIKPIACLTADEDDVRLSFDTFGSKNSAYYFLVFASGIVHDGWILDDGRTNDESWEGVWYRALKLYEDRWEVEIRIPFKSIRYKKDLDEWGITFARYMAGNRETSTWNEFLQKEELKVSKFGTLRNIKPQAQGYYFELYPEAYFRIDRQYVTIDSVATDKKPSASINLKWDVTPQATINATAFPDFAQIESDPFSLNLSRYPTYLDERRPFFLDGQEIFRMADFGDMGFFDPLEIFYSRRIGKSVNDAAVPILGGLKFTNKSTDWNLGVLGAYTDDYLDTTETHNIDEPNRWFGVLRAKRAVFENSHIGALFSGMAVDTDEYNYAFGVDGAYLHGPNQLVVQGALSSRKDSLSDRLGWAFDAGYFGFVRNFILFTSARIVQDSFDVSQIGFVPWVGEKKFMFLTGPFKEYNAGPIRNFFVAPGLSAIQNPGVSDWSLTGMVEFNTQFRTDWGFDIGINGGQHYEAPYHPYNDTVISYFSREFNSSFWGRLFNQNINFGFNYSYGWNYARGYLGYQGENRLSYTYSIIPQIRLGLASYIWIEWDSVHTVEAIWPIFRPSIDIQFNATTVLRIFDEIVTQTPGTDFGELEFLWNRIGVLFSWNFMPKSWLYVALNDHREQDEFGDLQPSYQIGAVKVKYLVYF